MRKSIHREISIFRRVSSFTTGSLWRVLPSPPVLLARPYIAAFIILCVSNSNFLFRPSSPLVPRPRAIHYSYQHPDRSTFCPCFSPAVRVGRLNAARCIVHVLEKVLPDTGKNPHIRHVEFFEWL